MKERNEEIDRVRTKTSQEVADLTQAINDKTVEKDKSLHRNNMEWKAKNSALMQVSISDDCYDKRDSYSQNSRF